MPRWTSWRHHPRPKQKHPLTKPAFPTYKPAAKSLRMQVQELKVATPAGFEPATFSLEGCCSIP